MVSVGEGGAGQAGWDVCRTAKAAPGRSVDEGVVESVSVGNVFDDIRCLRAYLDGAGYRALPGGVWPSGVVGAYANGEGDAVVMIEDPLLGLELRPLEQWWWD